MNSGTIDQYYQRAVQFLKPYIRYDVCKRIAELDRSMDPDRPFDFVHYLERSSIRYSKIFCRPLTPGAKWLEVGCLFPAFPIALSLAGIDVSVVEDFRFYPSEIHKMYSDVSAEFGIRFINRNASVQGGIHLQEEFDYASLMGVMEHLPHTPRFLLENIRDSLRYKGLLFVDVPNLYFSFNIRCFLRGQHIQQPIATLYHSGIPFVGHHREYSVSDVRYVLKESGFAVTHLELFNYSSDFVLRDLLQSGRLFRLVAQIPSFRETIFVQCQKS